MPISQLTSADANLAVNQQSADDANSNFDALIDLLASDDIAVADSYSSHSPHHTVQLRDASGKLAFDKIRLMFATQNLGPDRIDNKSPDTRSDTHHSRAQHENDIQDVFSKSGLSRSVSPSSQSSERGWQGSRLTSAGSSAPLDQTIQSTDELVHIGSDEHIFLSRDEPNAQNTTVSPVPCDEMPLPHQGGFIEKATTRPTDITVPLTEHAGRVQDLTKPLEFEQINVALSRATSEIDTLRERYEKLRALVTERLSPLNGLQTGKPSAQPSGNHDIPSSQAQGSDIQRGFESGHLEEISSLSEYEAKNILTGLVTSLRLSPRSITTLVSRFLDKDPVYPHPSSVDDIRSSMEFLARIDELVWKRSVPVDGDGPDLLYSRANTDALIERLALWEKTIRGHHKG
ncbi:uncharacterized protein BJ212DRAFT_1484018 [Suillus subaureus]|uniref:Uncharacterized protein n=1 Tax=Suillus subaureus TaxID=48587 RepID=A0A9P7JAA7_9AGAM|nr:uncharacterized protein BJ212DRAFT_1484018 [Suillus subaureus]KAG1810888.1 hypothetical protein BJ212DRAFT_1484018 [Suillus subaureus]